MGGYTITFANNDATITSLYLTFIQATGSGLPALSATYVDSSGQQQNIVNGQSYLLGTGNGAIGTMSITMAPMDWIGHLYLSDQPLPLGTVNPPTDPAYTITTDTVRFQNLEFAGSDTVASPDITYINWYSMPLQMSDGSNQRGVPSSQTALSALMNNLVNLAGNSPVLVVKNSQSQIIRVISPNAGMPNWLPLYPTFTSYLNSAFANGADPIQLNNTYSGVANPTSPNFEPQTYQSSSVVFDAAAQTITISGSTSVLGTFRMTMTADSAPNNSAPFTTEIYLTVISYQWQYSGQGSVPPDNGTGQTGNNDVFSAISRDFLAGFNFGFINSAAFGNQPSSAWMNAAAGNVFSAIQPSIPFYNPWANAMAAVFSDVYTFPFNDYLTAYAPELNVNIGDTLSVTVLSSAAENPREIHPPHPRRAVGQA